MPARLPKRKRALPEKRDGDWAAPGRMIDLFPYAEAACRGSDATMTLFPQRSLVCRMAFAVSLLGALAACQKNDASGGQLAGKMNDAAQQAGQKLDQAASYVGQQVDTAKQNLQSASATTITIDPSALASGAQANLQGAASATSAALGKAASLAGAGLQNAGSKLQQWSNNVAASSASAASGDSDSNDAQKQMDK